MSRVDTHEQDQRQLEASAMPLMEHLKELRRRILIAGGTIAVCVLGCFFVAQDIWGFLVQPMNEALRAQDAGSMAVLTPLEGIVTYMKVALVAGLFAAAPVIAWQVWAFVGPGLYTREKRVLVPLTICSTLLFVAGAAFGYFVIFKYAFGFFLAVTEGTAEAAISMESYLQTATRLLAAFGLSFQLPIVVYFLARIGLIDARDMVRGFKYSIVGIFIVAAVITPPDVLSQCLMAAPLTVLYGVGVVIAALVSTKKRGSEKGG
jgi:sec-independent protein translocase protein TatC